MLTIGFRGLRRPSFICFGADAKTAVDSVPVGFDAPNFFFGLPLMFSQRSVVAAVHACVTMCVFNDECVRVCGCFVG